MMGLSSDCDIAQLESNKPCKDLNIRNIYCANVPNNDVAIKAKNYTVCSNGAAIKVTGKEIITAVEHEEGELCFDDISPLNLKFKCQACLKKNEQRFCNVLLSTSDDDESCYMHVKNSCIGNGNTQFSRKGIGVSKITRSDEPFVGWAEASSKDASVNSQPKKEIPPKSKDKHCNGALGQCKEFPLWKDYRLRNDITYVFRHYKDLSKYMEQYRDEHTLCGKPDTPISPSLFQQKTTNHYDELVKKSEQETEIVTLPRILKALAQGNLISIVNNYSNHNNNNNNRLLGYVKPNPAVKYESNLLHKYKLAPRYRHQQSLSSMSQTGISVQTENNECSGQQMANYNVQFKMTASATQTCQDNNNDNNNNNNNSGQDSCQPSGSHSKQTVSSVDARICSAKQTIQHRASGTVNLTPTPDKIMPNRTCSNTPPNTELDTTIISNYAPFHPGRTRKQRLSKSLTSSNSDGGSTQVKKCSVPEATIATDDMWSPVTSLTLDKMANEKQALVQDIESVSSQESHKSHSGDSLDRLSMVCLGVEKDASGTVIDRNNGLGDHNQDHTSVSRSHDATDNNSDHHRITSGTEYMNGQVTETVNTSVLGKTDLQQNLKAYRNQMRSLVTCCNCDPASDLVALAFRSQKERIPKPASNGRGKAVAIGVATAKGQNSRDIYGSKRAVLMKYITVVDYNNGRGTKSQRTSRDLEVNSSRSFAEDVMLKRNGNNRSVKTRNGKYKTTSSDNNHDLRQISTAPVRGAAVAVDVSHNRTLGPQPKSSELGRYFKFWGRNMVTDLSETSTDMFDTNTEINPESNTGQTCRQQIFSYEGMSAIATQARRSPVIGRKIATPRQQEMPITDWVWPRDYFCKFTNGITGSIIEPGIPVTWFDAKGRSYVHTMDRYPVFRK